MKTTRTHQCQLARGVQILANTLFGSLSARPNAHIAERMAVLAGIPAKDVALSAIPAIPSLSESIKIYQVIKVFL